MKSKFLLLTLLSTCFLASCSTNFDSHNGKNYFGKDEIQPFNVIESSSRLVLKSKNKSSTAYTSYEASYSDSGITFFVEFADDDLYARNIYDIGYDDNFEMLINLKTEKSTWEVGKTYHFLLNANNKSFFQVANSSKSFGSSYNDSLHVVLGENLNYTFTLLNESEHGFNGFRSEVYFSYDVLNTTKDEAYGNLTFCPAMRNTHNYRTDTSWNYYTNLGCQRSNASHFININDNGTFGEKKEQNYDKLLIGDGLFSQSSRTTFDNDFKNIDITNLINKDASIDSWINNLKSMDNVSMNDLIISLGYNDLMNRSEVETFELLKEFLSKSSHLFNNIDIYLVSLIYTPTNYTEIKKVDGYNELMKDYATKNSNIHYIDITKLNGDGTYNKGNFNNGELNFLAYNYLSYVINDTFGQKIYNLPKIFGHNDKFYSSYGYEKVVIDGKEYVEGKGENDQYLVFAQNSSITFNASISLTANEVYNDDGYPKFGFALLGDNDTLFFYIDGSGGLTTQKVGYVIGKNHSSWQWGNSMEKDISISYSYGDYAKLNISRENGKISMKVDDSEIFNTSSYFANDEKLTVSILSFNSNILLKDYTIN